MQTQHICRQLGSFHVGSEGESVFRFSGINRISNCPSGPTHLSAYPVSCCTLEGIHEVMQVSTSSTILIFLAQPTALPYQLDVFIRPSAIRDLASVSSISPNGMRFDWMVERTDLPSVFSDCATHRD
jgi:hypothetical protein